MPVAKQRYLQEYLSDNHLIQTKMLKAAVDEALDVLGEPVKTVAVEDLKRRDLDLDDINRCYSLNEVKQIMEETFGEDAADLILIRVKQVLKKYGHY